MEIGEYMSFDEVDLNYIYGAIRFQLMETNWDLSDPDSWEEVNALKKLEMEIVATPSMVMDLRESTICGWINIVFKHFNIKM